MKRILAGLGCLIVAGLCVLWFVQTHEKREVSEDVPPQAEAFEDKFLAAQRLLQQFDVKSRSVRGLETEHAWPANAVLVLPAPRGMLSKAAAARLRSAV